MVEQARRKRTTITDGMERKMREMVESGVSRHEVARELGVSHPAVERRTLNLPSHEHRRGRSIRGWTLEFLQKISGDGFLVTGPEAENRFLRCYRTLRQYIPVRRVQADGRSVYFLVGRERDAFRAFVEARNTKSISYRRLCSLMPLFGIERRKFHDTVFGSRSLSEKTLRKIKSRKSRLGDAVSDYFGRILPPKLVSYA